MRSFSFLEDAVLFILLDFKSEEEEEPEYVEIFFFKFLLLEYNTN